MYSCTWNGQHQQNGQPSTSSQTAMWLTNDMRKQQARAANNLCQYKTVNMGVQQPQTTQFAVQNGSDNKTLQWETSQVLYQVPSPQQPARGMHYKNHLKTVLGSPHGNPCLLVTNEFQSSTQQNFYQNSAQSSRTLIQTNGTTTYPHQNNFTSLIQPVTVDEQQLVRMQGGNIVSNFQQCSTQNSSHQNINSRLTQTCPAWSPKATSQPPKQALYSHTLVPPTALNTQTALKENHRQGVIQHFPPISQYFEHKSITTNSSSGGQTGHVLLSQRPHQHSAQLTSAHGLGSTASINSNSNSYQCELRHVLQQENNLPSNPDAGALEETKCQRIARIKDFLCDSYTPASVLRQSVTSRTQYSVNAPPQQSSAPDVDVPKTRDGNGGEAGNVFFPKNDSVSNGNLAGPLNDASQWTQMAKTLMSVNNQDTTLEKLSLVKQSDSSIQSSPGCAGMRAIAVVQPLSQETCQVSQKNTISQLGSPGAKGLSQQQSCANAKECELATNMQVDCHIAPVAQESVTDVVPANQNGGMDKRETPADPTEYFDLSSVPTTPWTTDSLNKLILDASKAQLNALGTQDVTKFHPVSSKILNMFWDGSLKRLAPVFMSARHNKLITNAEQFCRKHVTPDCVILSQVKQGTGKQLNSYHVLNDNEVYSEIPYTSSWLNVNKQVDCIDKEFGYPQSLKHHLRLSDSGIKSDHLKTEIKDSTDPHYSFEIQVLPPEEAKHIFEQLQRKNIDSPPEKVMKSCAYHRLPDASDVSMSDSKLDNKAVSKIDEVCCISRWIEQIVGSVSLEGSNLSKCQCKTKGSDKDCTDVPLDMEGMTVQKSNGLSAISKSHFDIKEKAGEGTDSPILTSVWPDVSRLTIDLTKDDEEPHSHSDKETTNISQISLNDSLSSVILISDKEDESLSSSEIPDLIPKFGILMSDPDEEEDCAQDQLKPAESNQSSSSDHSEMGATKVSTSEIMSHMSDPEEEEDCAQDQLKPVESNQSSSLDHSEMGSTKVSTSEIMSHMSDPLEDCALALPTSTDVDMESRLEEGQIQIRASTSPETPLSLCGKHGSFERKRKLPNSHKGMFPFKCRRSVHLNSQPATKGIKHKRDSVSATESKASASNTKSVKLMLFGPAEQRKLVVAQRPPEVLDVEVSPHRTMPSAPTAEYSVKQRIYEKWLSSYPLTNIRHRRKLKTHYKLSSTAANTKQPVTKHFLSRRKRKSHILGEEKSKKYMVTPSQPKQEGRNADNESHAAMPLKKNIVLKFSTLPDTFNFVTGPDKRKHTTHPVSDNSDLDEKKDKIFSKTTSTSKKGIWCPRPEKKYCPLRSPLSPTTSDDFEEFRKKYKKRTQASTST